MNSQRRTCVAVCVSIASILGVCGQAAGFNPQPEPPGMPHDWYVEGYVDMLATEVELNDTEMPFGISSAEVNFTASLKAQFDAPSTADNKPVDGLYDADFEYLLLDIGDTSWDESMITTGDIQFEVSAGVVTGCTGAITDTMPEHPDLSFELPTSPGTWAAVDERYEDNVGTVRGTYELRDIPEPAAACLVALGGLAVLCRRRK